MTDKKILSMNNIYFMPEVWDTQVYFTSLTLSFKTLNVGFLVIFLLNSARTSSSVLKFPSAVNE